MSNSIHIQVEMEPRTEAIPAGVLLNRPAPQGGAFLIEERLPKTVWDQLKKAGAWYWSAEELEDFDMFHSIPGWRYPIQALRQLLSAGYSLTIRDTSITTEAELDALFTPTACAAYRQRRAAEHQAAAEREAAAKAVAEREAAAKEATYIAWKEAHLAGLVKSSIGPHAGSGVEWQRLVHFDADTPGTWYTTGDTWYIAQIDGVTVYQCHYGNASVCYAPQAIVDQWCEESWQWRLINSSSPASAARSVLEYAVLHDGNTYGDDVAFRLVELHGRDYFIELANSEPWYVDESEVQRLVKLPQFRHGLAALANELNIPVIPMQPITVAYRLRESLKSPRTNANAREVYKDPAGDLFGKTDYAEWFPLTESQIAFLAVANIR